ncbi:Translation machinery-associated protein 22 [Thecaphora frezii]
MSDAGPSTPPPAARTVVYCSICTFPPEYCEFGPSASKCRTWLESAQPQLYARIWSEEAITSNLAALTTKQAEDLEKEAAKKEKKSEAKAEKEKKEKALLTPKSLPNRLALPNCRPPKLSSQRPHEPNARQRPASTVCIPFLLLCPPSKSLPKGSFPSPPSHLYLLLILSPSPSFLSRVHSLSSRLATGASVSRSVQNPNVDEIVIQGDVADEVKQLIVSRTKPFHELPPESAGGIAAKNIIIEEEKKAAAKKAPAPGADEAA